MYMLSSSGPRGPASRRFIDRCFICTAQSLSYEKKPVIFVIYENKDTSEQTDELCELK